MYYLCKTNIQKFERQVRTNYWLAAIVHENTLDSRCHGEMDIADIHPTNCPYNPSEGCTIFISDFILPDFNTFQTSISIEKWVLIWPILNIDPQFDFTFLSELSFSKLILDYYTFINKKNFQPLKI